MTEALPWPAVFCLMGGGEGAEGQEHADAAAFENPQHLGAGAVVVGEDDVVGSFVSRTGDDGAGDFKRAQVLSPHKIFFQWHAQAARRSVHRLTDRAPIRLVWMAGIDERYRLGAAHQGQATNQKHQQPTHIRSCQINRPRYPLTSRTPPEGAYSVSVTLLRGFLCVGVIIVCK